LSRIDRVREYFFTYFDSGEEKKMKKLSLSIVTALVFFVATAMAQTTPATDPQGTSPTTASPSASPSNQTSTPEAQTPAAQPATTPPAGTQSASATEPKGEKKLKGCIESENGKFVLEAKHGKEITLTGQDVSAHVGHQVVVHGTFQNSMAASASGETPGAAASAGSTSTSSTGTTAGSTDTKAKAGQEFNVTSVDMVASTCKDKDKDKAGEKHEHDKSSTQPPQ
jgi:hypothetical protein